MWKFFRTTMKPNSLNNQGHVRIISRSSSNIDSNDKEINEQNSNELKIDLEQNFASEIAKENSFLRHDKNIKENLNLKGIELNTKLTDIELNTILENKSNETNSFKNNESLLLKNHKNQPVDPILLSNDEEPFGTISKMYNKRSKYSRQNLDESFDKYLKKKTAALKETKYNDFQGNDIENDSDKNKLQLKKRYNKNKQHKSQNNSVVNENKVIKKSKTNKNKSDNETLLENNVIEEKEEEIFGSLSTNLEIEKLEDDKDDLDTRIFLDYGDSLTDNEYGRKMLALCQQKKIKEAVDVLEIEMKAQRVVPSEYCYNVLISGCGKVGFYEKAFQLYDRLKGQDLKIQKHTYTSLFNACANSPFVSDAYERAKNFYKRLQTLERPLNTQNYHAIIKAFGRGGDIEGAFNIVDEMLSKNLVITTETMNFLLQACITDEKNGFEPALMVWRRMRGMLLKPDTYSYQLLLRCVEKCGVGEPEAAGEILQRLGEEQQRLSKVLIRQKSFIASKKTIAKESTVELSDISTQSHIIDEPSPDKESTHTPKIVLKIGDVEEMAELTVVDNAVAREEEALLPSVLSEELAKGNVDVLSLDDKSQRLAFLGGPKELLKSMVADNATPDVKTFRILLNSLPQNTDVEESLLDAMKEFNVTPNIFIYNEIIKRRNGRRERKEAEEVLMKMHKHNVEFDMHTFGALAFNSNKMQMRQLIRDMENMYIRPNLVIMGTFISRAVSLGEFKFLLDLLNKFSNLGLAPNEIVIRKLEEGRKAAKNFLLYQDRNDEELLHKSVQRRRYHCTDEELKDEANFFLIKYNKWLHNQKMEAKGAHPWKQFGYDSVKQKKKVN